MICIWHPGYQAIFFYKMPNTNHEQDETIILVKEAKAFVKSFNTEKLEPAENENVLFLLQTHLEGSRAVAMLHPLKCQLLAAFVFAFEEDNNHLEDLRDALQWQMVANTDYIFKAEKWQLEETSFKQMNKVQSNLLTLVNKLIDNNLRLYPTRKF